MKVIKEEMMLLRVCLPRHTVRCLTELGENRGISASAMATLFIESQLLNMKKRNYEIATDELTCLITHCANELSKNT